MSEKNKIGFINFQYKGNTLIPGSIEIDREQLEAQRMFHINTDYIRKRPAPPDTRTRLRKLIDEIKRRISNAWQSLKGAEWD